MLFDVSPRPTPASPGGKAARRHAQHASWLLAAPPSPPPAAAPAAAEPSPPAAGEAADAADVGPLPRPPAAGRDLIAFSPVKAERALPPAVADLARLLGVDAAAPPPEPSPWQAFDAAFAAALGPPPPPRSPASPHGFAALAAARAPAALLTAAALAAGSDPGPDGGASESGSNDPGGERWFDARSALPAPPTPGGRPGSADASGCGGPGPAAAAPPPARSPRAAGAARGVRRGHARLLVCVRAAHGVAYRRQLDRPVATLSVLDSQGRLAELPRDSLAPGRHDRGAGAVAFPRAPLALATPPRALPPGGVLVVELRHWKAGKQRFSTHSWAAVPLEALLDAGPAAARVRACVLRLPLLRKPVDASRGARPRPARGGAYSFGCGGATLELEVRGE